MNATKPETADPSESLEALFRRAVAAYAQPFWPVVDEIAPTLPITALGAYRNDDGAR